MLTIVQRRDNSIRRSFQRSLDVHLRPYLPDSFFVIVMQDLHQHHAIVNRTHHNAYRPSNANRHNQTQMRDVHEMQTKESLRRSQDYRLLMNGLGISSPWTIGFHLAGLCESSTRVLPRMGGRFSFSAATLKMFLFTGSFARRSWSPPFRRGESPRPL